MCSLIIAKMGSDIMHVKRFSSDYTSLCLVAGGGIIRVVVMMQETNGLFY